MGHKEQLLVEKKVGVLRDRRSPGMGCAGIWELGAGQALVLPLSHGQWVANGLGELVAPGRSSTGLRQWPRAAAGQGLLAQEGCTARQQVVD